MVDRWKVRCAAMLLAAFISMGQAGATEETDTALAETTPPGIVPPVKDVSEQTVEAVEPGPDPEWKARTENIGEYLEEGEARRSGTDSNELPDEEGPPSQHRTGGLLYALRVVAGLFFVCAAIIFLGWFLKKFGKRTPLLAGQKLGEVMGKVYLSPRASLHYVKSGGRVLVVGMTQNSISLITEFDVEDFESGLGADEELPQVSGEPRSFLTQLRTNAQRIGNAPAPAALMDPADDEIASLRGDLERLQKHLMESSREIDS